jgi:hypothetical protein
MHLVVVLVAVAEQRVRLLRPAMEAVAVHRDLRNTLMFPSATLGRQPELQARLFRLRLVRVEPPEHR